MTDITRIEQNARRSRASVFGNLVFLAGQVADDKAGYVWDYARQGYPVWGMKARPGKAHVWVYPKCKGGRLVADVERLDKGHTEGLEPNVTEALIALLVCAPGGKSQKGAAAKVSA